MPERPHPNCRCTVEITEDETETGSEEPQGNKDKLPPRIPTPQPTPKQHISFKILGKLKITM